MMSLSLDFLLLSALTTLTTIRAQTYTISQNLSGSNLLVHFKLILHQAFVDPHSLVCQHSHIMKVLLIITILVRCNTPSPLSSSNTKFAGNVHFLSQSDAVADNLTYVDSNGHVIIKVDNTTDANGDSTFGRNSVYLESNEMMTIGSLLVFDAVHIPYGVCLSEKVLNRSLIVSQVLGVAIPVYARARLARQWRDGLDRKCESGYKQSVFPPCRFELVCPI